MGVKESEYRHGVARGDIDHALSNPIALHYMDGWLMVIGPSKAGALLEIGINSEDDVFHAMRARPKYLEGR